MEQLEIDSLFLRIERLKENQKPLFGKMNAHQMICHCTDQIRLALGTLETVENGGLTPKEVFEFSNAGKTVPAPKGMDQVAGEGTQPTTFNEDIATLKQHITEFSELDDNFEYGQHPYFGDLTREKWISLTIYHLDHHLKQFNV